MKDGKTSAIIVVPLLILLLVAGAAAGLGIALGQDDDANASTSAPVVTAADLGAACTTPPGPRPSTASELPAWLRAVRTCVAEELQGVRGYASIAVEGFGKDVVVLHWSGSVPAAVTDRVARIAGSHGVTVVTSR